MVLPSGATENAQVHERNRTCHVELRALFLYNEGKVATFGDGVVQVVQVAQVKGAIGNT